MEVLLYQAHSIVCALVYFDPNFKAKIKLFLTFMQTIQCAESQIFTRTRERRYHYFVSQLQRRFNDE